MSVGLAAVHLMNFLAPSLGLALGLAVLEGFLIKNRRSPQSLIRSFALYFFTGAGVLMLGLALLGRDGKMGTYLALVLATGSLAAWRHPGR
jgi:hypothetical protein